MNNNFISIRKDYLIYMVICIFTISSGSTLVFISFILKFYQILFPSLIAIGVSTISLFGMILNNRNYLKS